MNWLQSDEMSGLSDEELAFRAADGDENCFAALLVRYERIIEIKASKFQCAGLGQDKSDFMQEGTIGFLGAVRSYRTDKGASFMSYASKCIESKMLTLYKKASGYKHRPLNSFISLSSEDDLGDISMRFPQSSIVDPETTLLERERIESIKKKISDSLSNMEHNVFTLYLRGMTYTEIAATLVASVKSVDNALSRIRRKL